MSRSTIRAPTLKPTSAHAWKKKPKKTPPGREPEGPGRPPGNTFSCMERFRLPVRQPLITPAHLEPRILHDAEPASTSAFEPTEFAREVVP